jgi:enterochelin esterase-like enzyme
MDHIELGNLNPAFLLLLFLLPGCISAPVSPTPEQKTPGSTRCTQPGMIQWLRVDPIGEIGLYLPPCYQKAENFAYPVLYLFPVFGGSDRDWFSMGVARVADDMIRGGEVPPFLIVTTGETFQDFNANFIVSTLIPYIETYAHASRDRRNRAVAGGSLGGASAYYLVFQHPELFASAGVFGNGLVMGQEAQVRSMLRVIPPGLKPRLFLNSGEEDPYMLQQAKAMIPLLAEAGIPSTEVFSPGDHSYKYWISNFPAFFRWLGEDLSSEFSIAPVPSGSVPPAH